MAWQKDPSVVSESVVFNGRTYNRYPEAKFRSHRVYFSRSGGRSFLHRDVWAYHYGEIPVGHHIHHINGDSSDNRIENLQCLPSNQHFNEHTPERVAYGNSAENLDHLSFIRQKAAEKFAELRKDPKTVECLECGSTFQSSTGRAKLCSNTCAARKSRRQRKLENV